MPYKQVDPSSGAIIFRKTYEERRMEDFERKYKELQDKYDNLQKIVYELVADSETETNK